MTADVTGVAMAAVMPPEYLQRAAMAWTAAAFCRASALIALSRQLCAIAADIGSGKISSSPVQSTGARHPCRPG